LPLKLLEPRFGDAALPSRFTLDSERLSERFSPLVRRLSSALEDELSFREAPALNEMY